MRLNIYTFAGFTHFRILTTLHSFNQRVTTYLQKEKNEKTESYL